MDTWRLEFVQVEVKKHLPVSSYPSGYSCAGTKKLSLRELKNISKFDSTIQLFSFLIFNFLRNEDNHVDINEFKKLSKSACLSRIQKNLINCWKIGAVNLFLEGQFNDEGIAVKLCTLVCKRELENPSSTLKVILSNCRESCRNQGR